MTTCTHIIWTHFHFSQKFLNELFNRFWLCSGIGYQTTVLCSMLFRFTATFISSLFSLTQPITSSTLFRFTSTLTSSVFSLTQPIRSSTLFSFTKTFFSYTKDFIFLSFNLRTEASPSLSQALFLAFLSLSQAVRNSLLSTVSGLSLLFLIAHFLLFLLLLKTWPHASHTDFLQCRICLHTQQTLCNGGVATGSKKVQHFVT